MKLHNRFAIVKLWDTICAEDENIQQFIGAARAMGIECAAVDNQYRLLSDKTKIATECDFDFVLHLHFDSVKINNLFSFVALWNPTQFYHDWDYRRFSDNILTHDDFLTSRSVGAEDHLARLIYEDEFHLPPRFELFPSSSSHIYPPQLRGDKRLHYCGINWERCIGKKTRHGDLLDELDKQGLVDIYGPKILDETDVWKGYSGYKGELPFDGHSIIESIHRSGISLVLSSKAHLQSQLMSNRLFEALAAGANIICDENKFVKKHMKDCVFYVNSLMPLAERIEATIQHLNWINGHPEESYEMAREGQRIFQQEFNLEFKIRHIYDHLLERKQQIQNLHMVADDRPIHICYLFNTQDDPMLEEDLAESIIANAGDNIFHHIYASPFVAERVDTIFSSKNIFIIPVFFGDENNEFLGKIVKEFLDVIADDSYFSVVMPNEKLQENHFSALARTIADKNVDAAYSKYISLTEDGSQMKDINYRTVSTIETDKPAVFSGLFLFSKHRYIASYRIFLPYIRTFVFGYFYLLADKFCCSHKFSCQVRTTKFFTTKDFHDAQLLLDIKHQKHTDILSGIEIPKESLRKRVIKYLGRISRPFFEKTFLYGFLKKVYIKLIN